MGHVLDFLEDFTNDWVNWLGDTDADHIGKDTVYEGARCPFAKKASDDGKIKYVKVYDYFCSYDFWEAVSKEVDAFDDTYDVVLVVAKSNADHINQDNMGGGVDGLNTFLNIKGKDIWLLCKIDEMYTIVMVQRITALDNASKQLEAKGYYVGHYSKRQMDKIVTGRAKYRERLPK